MQAKAEFTAGVKQKWASAGISLAFCRNNIYNRNGMKKLLLLFWEFFKIGLFTFGGGYAMVAVIERTLVEKKKWIEQEEFMDVIAIAESTPGPIAINSATYIGYKVKGFWGSVFATLGVVLPSLIVIYIISLFFDQFLALEYVGYAFKGIQACVAFLIVSAGIKMLKPLKKNAFNIIIITAVIAAMITLELLAADFSTIYLILMGGALGIIVYYCSRLAAKRKDKKATPGQGVQQDGAFSEQAENPAEKATPLSSESGLNEGEKSAISPKSQENGKESDNKDNNGQAESGENMKNAEEKK